jgi:outer membrane receptor protein involved in Fe transport
MHANFTPTRSYVRRSKLPRALAILTAALFSSCAIPVLAQDAPSPQAPSSGDASKDGANSGEIVVTGSRVARDGFQSPTPLLTLSAEELERNSNGNVADAINDLPALRASITPSSTPNFSALLGGNFLDLRGLGYLRTLVLVDGRRYVPSTPSGAVNVNIIPQALIAGSDVVTGGASAAYGSDAVAGVVNFRLNDKLNGIRGSVQAGITDHNDYRNYTISLAAGTSFGGGRGHFVIGGTIAENGGIAFQSDRDWGRYPGLISNPAYVVGGTAPRWLLVSDSRAANVSYGGVINTAGRLRGIQFAPDGTAIPFTYGSNLTTTQMNGGDGVPAGADNVLVSPTRRHNVLARANYALTDSITGFVEGVFARSQSDNLSITGSNQLTIRRDNAFLPASIRDIMTANTFVMGRSLNDYSRGTLEGDTRTWQIQAGLRGDFGGGWSWDASYGYGETRNFTLFGGALITANLTLAVDAVVNPANGAIVCRSTLTNPGNGCVPINLFGVGNASPQAIDYVTADSPRLWQIGQHVAQATVRGEPFSTWAGPVSFATGVEARWQEVDVTSDAPSAAGIYRVGNTIPWSADQSVKEAFAEFVAPLARDAGWARSLELNGAVRVTDYSNSGTVVTWKGGLTWSINDWIRLRGTRSRDIRAPGIDDLYAAGNTLIFSVADPLLGETYSVSNVVGGNPALQPEKADTLTLGAVLAPRFAPGLELSVDYYDINIEGAMATLTVSGIVQQCNLGITAACGLVERDGPNGRITRIRTAPANLDRASTSGIDVELAYRRRIGPGQMNLRGRVTWVNELRLVGPSANLNAVGMVDSATVNGMGGTPRWRGNFDIGYTVKGYRLGVVGRYIAAGVISHDVVIDKPDVPARLYIDVNAEAPLYRNGAQRVVLFARVRNLFDKDPPIIGAGTARALYDVIGRTYSTGVRFAF